MDEDDDERNDLLNQVDLDDVIKIIGFGLYQ